VLKEGGVSNSEDKQNVVLTKLRLNQCCCKRYRASKGKVVASLSYLHLGHVLVLSDGPLDNVTLECRPP
jgi:hypothetical protein